jgi:hypothetical protein
VSADRSRMPFGHRSYGSIGHLPGSRLGPADHVVAEGQAKICCEKVRDRHDLVIVQEKVDGSNVAAGMIDGRIVAITRAGYLAATSPYPQHWAWARWVEQNEHRFREVIREGERLCGEWLALAHGTQYELPHEPFVAFDLMIGTFRASFRMFHNRLRGEFITPALIHLGGSISIAEVNERIQTSLHGAPGPAEGAVWRIERQGTVDFLAKWVRPGKVDGCFLPEQNGGVSTWNWRPPAAWLMGPPDPPIV